MKKNLYFILAAGLALGACGHREPEAALYSTPGVSLTVNSQEELGDADKDAGKFCRKYDKRAERESVTPAGDKLSVTYQCR